MSRELGRRVVDRSITDLEMSEHSAEASRRQRTVHSTQHIRPVSVWDRLGAKSCAFVDLFPPLQSSTIHSC